MPNDSENLLPAAVQSHPSAETLVRAVMLACAAPAALLAATDRGELHLQAVTRPCPERARQRLVDACRMAAKANEPVIIDIHEPACLRFADPGHESGAAAPGRLQFIGMGVRAPGGTVLGVLGFCQHGPLGPTHPSLEILASMAELAAAILSAGMSRTALPPPPAGRLDAARQIALVDIAASEARFRAMSDASPHGVFFADSAGDCAYMNRRCREIVGLSAPSGGRQSWFETVHPEDSPAVHDEWTRTAAEHVPFDMTCRVRCDDGMVRRIHVRSQALFGPGGSIEGFVGSIEDVTGQDRTLARLSASEKRLRHLYEATPALMQSIDPHGRILAVSDAWLARFDYAREDVIGRHAAEFLTEESRANARETLLPVLFETGACGDIEIRMLTRDGMILDMLLSAVLERKPDGSPLRSLVVFEDITQRKRAERALRLERERTQHANERFALATRTGGIGVWEFDRVSRMFRFDEQVARLYGQPVGSVECSLDDWLASLHPDDRQAAGQAFEASLDGEQAFDIEFRIQWPDASLHHIRSAGRLESAELEGPGRMVGVNWDVTELRKLALELAEEHELLRVTLESIGDAVITTDRNGDVTWMNPVAERMTGWLSVEAAGRPLLQVFHIINQETREPAINPVACALSEGRIVGLANQTLLVSREGTEFGIEDSAAPIRDGVGQIKGAVLVFHDVTEQRRLSGEMNFRATHDPLTELLNRSEFEMRLQRLLRGAQEDRGEHALLFIDLDQFKVVNDACGHAIGDQLLQQVARLLAQAVRGRDTLARLGGDEFAVILEHCNADQAQRVAREICERIDQFRFVHGERRFRIGASIGLVPVDDRWTTIAALMQAADSACYAAKDGGRNRVHIWFDTDQAIRARNGETQWAARLATALDEGYFELYAQRVFDLHDAATGINAEVLLRLREPDSEPVLPGAFLPAAERFHLMGRIDRWVLLKTLEWLAGIRSPEKIQNLSINLSGQSIGDRAFHAWAIAQLRQAGPDVCHKISFEITETAAITNLADASVFIDHVQALGVRIALDDFGAGASSFGYLKNLSIDTLKIDGQFVRDLADDPLNAAAVRCFSDVARVVGVQSVAEFVETEAVLAKLHQLNIDFAQGFLLHRPAPIDLLDDQACGQIGTPPALTVS